MVISFQLWAPAVGAILIRRTILVGVALWLSGCASNGLIENKPLNKVDVSQSSAIVSLAKVLSNADQGIMLAFSGGGTRAAALSYGVLQQLRDTSVVRDGKPTSLLDDVGLISSVSGGSFTAAYYGLHGRDIFKNFEEAFLRKNVEAALVENLLNPLHWFGSLDRTEYAIRYYDREVFKNATFKDMRGGDAPLILINATDLSHGVRFSFMQEYFNLLCSDLSSFPVSRAVTASSSVPVLFDPVVLKNYDSCKSEIPRWLQRARQRSEDDPELQLTVSGLESYFDRENHKYAHFVDGGITDNLGLRSIFDMTRLIGNGQSFLSVMGAKPAPRLVVISVDASTKPEYKMGYKREAPDIFTTISSMTDIQLHRYNTATLAEMQRSLDDWAEQLSTPEHQIDVFFIKLSFSDIKSDELKNYINQIPTNFNLSDNQVDTVIESGRSLLKNNPEFQRLLEDMRAESQ
jgi:NTE family protein